MKRKAISAPIALASVFAIFTSVFSNAESLETPIFRASTANNPSVPIAAIETKSTLPTSAPSDWTVRIADLLPYLETKSSTLLGWHPITKQALVRTLSTSASGGNIKLNEPPMFTAQMQVVETAGGKMKALSTLPDDARLSEFEIGKAWFEPKIGSYLI